MIRIGNLSGTPTKICREKHGNHEWLILVRIYFVKTKEQILYQKTFLVKFSKQQDRIRRLNQIVIIMAILIQTLPVLLYQIQYLNFNHAPYKFPFLLWSTYADDYVYSIYFKEKPRSVEFSSELDKERPLSSGFWTIEATDRKNARENTLVFIVCVSSRESSLHPRRSKWKTRSSRS